MKLLNPLRWLYVTLLTLLALGALRLLVQGPVFETDILALLPTIHRNPTTESALRAQARSAAAKVVVIVRSPSSTNAEREALRVSDELRSSGLFARVDARLTLEDLVPLSRLFERYPFQLAKANQGGGGAAQILREAKERIFSPDSLHWIQRIDHDPLLLFPVYLESILSDGGKFSISNGFIHRDTPNSKNVLIVAHTKNGSFERGAQTAVVSALSRLSVQPPATLVTSGIILFANESATRTEAEVKTLSLVTLVAVVGLLIAIFRSISVVVSITAVIVLSFLGALALSHAIIGELHGTTLHLITLGFGSCLLGVSVDYAIHFFVVHRSWRVGARGSPIRRITSGLLLAFITTAVGFIGIVFSPFPGLQQLAIFCIVGLLLALLSVLLLLPWIAGPPRHDPRLESLASKVSHVLGPRSQRVATVALLALLILGLPRVRALDDVRVLNKPSQALLTRQREVAELMGISEGGTAIIVEGASDDEVLERQESLRERLDQLRHEGKLGGYRSLSELVPSKTRQHQIYRGYAHAFATSPGAFTTYAQEIHLGPEAVATLSSLSTAEPSRFASSNECLTSDACRMVEDLWHTMPDGTVVGTIALDSCTIDPDTIVRDIPGARAVNHADAISRALQLYRLSATETVLLFYLGVYLLVSLRYGIKHSWRVMAPAIAGAGAALAALGLAGIPLNAFSVFALIVLLGVGIDYAIFFAEERESDGATALAVILSTGTTIISFGALSFSSTPALQSFGVVLSVGVIFAALLSPLAQRGSPDQ